MRPAGQAGRAPRAAGLVDHQDGLLSLVRDIDPDKFKNNVLALADIAEYFKLPTILTTSFEDGPNGPLVLELHRDWRNDVEGLATLLNNHIPDYRNRMSSYATMAKAK